MKLFLFFLLAFSVFVSLPAWGQRIDRVDRIYFSNIAPGELESEDVRKLPVKIVLQSESGIMYGGVFIRVFNEAGVAIFKYLCEKPWLFLNLPAGNYNVAGVDRNKITRIKQFHVKGGEGAHTVVKLSWPKTAVGY